jgi:hypothetical protein
MFDIKTTLPLKSKPDGKPIDKTVELDDSQLTRRLGFVSIAAFSKLIL